MKYNRRANTSKNRRDKKITALNAARLFRIIFIGSKSDAAFNKARLYQEKSSWKERNLAAMSGGHRRV